MSACRNLSRDEVRAIAAELNRGRNPERDATLFLLGCYVGGRISSLLSLRVCDVIQVDGSPAEVLTFRRATTKGKRASHSVALSKECRIIISRYLDYRQRICSANDRAYLFTTKWGSKPITRNHAYKIINGAARRAGIGGVIGTHSMRKTFARSYYDSYRGDYLAGLVTDDPLESLQLALGHASIQSTSKYLAVSREVVGRFTRRISYK